MPTLNKMNFLRLLDQSRAEENLCDVEFRVVDPVNKPLGTVPSVLRIRDVYLFTIPDPGSSSKNLSILTPKKAKKMVSKL
jgi:hypothetical protein